MELDGDIGEHFTEPADHRKHVFKIHRERIGTGDQENGFHAPFPKHFRLGNGFINGKTAAFEMVGSAEAAVNASVDAVIGKVDRSVKPCDVPETHFPDAFRFFAHGVHILFPGKRRNKAQKIVERSFSRTKGAVHVCRRRGIDSAEQFLLAVFDFRKHFNHYLQSRKGKYSIFREESQQPIRKNRSLRKCANGLSPPFFRIL